MINPKTTDLNRRMDGGITKNDKLDTLNICDILSSNKLKKPYRLTSSKKFDLYEQKQLTRLHHSLKEQINVLSNRLQKCIDLVFPEYNSLFNPSIPKSICLFLNSLAVQRLLHRLTSEHYANALILPAEAIAFLWYINSSRIWRYFQLF